VLVQGKYWVLGNWKMHLTVDEAGELSRRIAGFAYPAEVSVGVAPSYVHIATAVAAARDAALLTGAQDCHAQPQGAHTGDVSADMLKDAGCQFVIVGHSERRQNHGETSEAVRAKAQAAQKAGLHVVLCVGETLAQRESGQCFAVVEEQLRASLPDDRSRDALTIAYEPVWAIGTGKTASNDDIAGMHHHIADVLSGLTTQKNVSRILYGGSVKANNALDILALPVVDGVLVGGASLDADAFHAIIQAAQNAATQR